MGKEHLLIIGGVAAGLAAAMEARRSSPELGITVLERTGDISYGACGARRNQDVEIGFSYRQ